MAPKTDAPRVARILATLGATYPDATTALDYVTPFQFLVAVILSAQCTDVRVNEVTRALFGDFWKPADFAVLNPEELEVRIRKCGLGRSKAKNIVAMSRRLLDRHGGAVPSQFEELIRLPGVGRKTANVILASLFGVPAIAVDTHVYRVSHRLGFSGSTTPARTERDLQALIPRSDWAIAHHWFIWHGRTRCRARNPACIGCPLLENCPTGRNNVGMSKLPGLSGWCIDHKKSKSRPNPMD